MKIKDYDNKGLFDENKKKPKVRNFEGKIDLPDDKPEIKGEYGQAEDMLDMWGLDKQEATLGRKKRRRFILTHFSPSSFSPFCSLGPSRFTMASLVV